MAGLSVSDDLLTVWQPQPEDEWWNDEYEYFPTQLSESNVSMYAMADLNELVPVWLQNHQQVS